MAAHNYDLEERAFQFAKSIRLLVKQLPKTLSNREDAKLLRCSASIGANYIEANEALSKKDFLYRIKIARKEAKESIFFLRLLEVNANQDLQKTQTMLIDEATQLMKILGSILTKST